MKTKSCGIKAGRRMKAYAGVPLRTPAATAKKLAVAKYLRTNKK